MQKPIIIACILLGGALRAQIIDPNETARRKATDRANSRIDQGIDKGLDKLEEGIGSIFKKKDKKKPDTDEGGDPAAENASPERPSGNSTNSSVSSKNGDASLKSYSRFDFIPGEKIIAAEDFSQDEVGDFPGRWNTNATGEVVTINAFPDRWLKPGSTGIYFPEFVDGLPENFTMEFDMAVSDDLSEMQSGLKIIFVDIAERNTLFDQHFNNAPKVGVDLHPAGERGQSQAWVVDKSRNTILDNHNDISWHTSRSNRISIWRQKTRFRLYINENKVWDLPRAFIDDVVYAPLFATNLWEGNVYISNIRIAAGAPDTRNKLITEGKLVTRGITFDVNSDKIKAESYGTLKEIAQVLKENPGVNVKIIGHTDSDGDEKSNLELSRRRAASVRKTLSSEFSISESRLETDGKGESEPVEPNTTPQGKANNRRVEFVKM